MSKAPLKFFTPVLLPLRQIASSRCRGPPHPLLRLLRLLPLPVSATLPPEQLVNEN